MIKFLFCSDFLKHIFFCAPTCNAEEAPVESFENHGLNEVFYFKK